MSREAGKTQVSTDTNKLQVFTKAEKVSSVDMRKSEEKCAQILNVNCGIWSSLITVLTAFNKFQVSTKAGRTVLTAFNKLQVSREAGKTKQCQH